MDKDEFFAWCRARNLHGNKEIGAALSLSSQTIGNWRKAESLPPWLELACEGYDIAMRTAPGPFPTFPRMTSTFFRDWQIENDLRTYEAVGEAFGGISRQAVHNWSRRYSFPNWVILACIGIYGRRIMREAEKERSAIQKETADAA